MFNHEDDYYNIYVTEQNVLDKINLQNILIIYNDKDNVGYKLLLHIPSKSIIIVCKMLFYVI